MKIEDVAIYGTGGHAREIMWIAHRLQRNIAANIDDSGTMRLLDGRRVYHWIDFAMQYRDVLMIIGIGSPEAREKIADRVATFRFDTLIDPTCVISPNTSIGIGVVVFPQCVLSVNVKIGNHVHINVGSSISHDSSVGDFTTISPGVRICGNVCIGRSVYIGAGATIINGSPSEKLTIGDRAYIGAGACVVNSLDGGSLYTGVPAKMKRHR